LEPLIVPLHQKGRGEMPRKYLESFFKFSLMVLCLAGLLYGTSRLERAFSIRMRPPAPMVPTVAKDEVEETLTDLHAPLERLPSLNTWIKAASRVTSLDPILLCCLIHSESRFKKDVVSPKGYKGEAQTKRFSQYSSVNILEGAETLREKLSQSSGDIFEALARYKGGKDNKEAREEAMEVLRLYRSQLEKRGLARQGVATHSLAMVNAEG
jgi:hypothetical protein